uniref:protein-tyrosine-phosphatase n=1 Tax=Crassostrea virginica TaxID=6565 RepID=A0A8B8CD44_CRAVI|nr:uncharacterized protein LOC111118076 isoform X2 [Crassostrea virginica]
MSSRSGDMGWSIIFCFLVIRLSSSEYCSYENGRTYQNKDSCTELEHCSSGFDPRSGQCPQNECEPGWMGPACQYVNLALNSLNRDNVFDGKMSTHRSIPDATVRLGGHFVIEAIRIHIYYRYPSSTVTIKDNKMSVLFDGKFPLIMPTVYLKHPVLTNQLNIHFSSQIDVKEIEVFGGKNVALWKPTNQTSTFTQNGIRMTSDKAVDGNAEGNFSYNSCTHTSGGDATRWTVNLRNAYSIIAIKIKNRATNRNRINGFTLYGTMDNGTRILIYNDISPTLDRGEIWLDSSIMPDVPISGVSIIGPTNGEKILTLCEVFIYACIPKANGSDKCDSFCPKNCISGSVCSKRRLECPVCQNGWAKPYCDKKITCQRPQTYGTHLSVNPWKDLYSYKDVITFSCSEGYQLTRSVSLMCGNSGHFEGRLPTCAKITCQRPQTYGTHLSVNPWKDLYSYKDVITFSCSEGYQLTRSVSLMCGNSGHFEGRLPTCAKITCQRPQTYGTHLSVNPWKDLYSYKDVITFSCSEGYQLTRSVSLMCGNSGHFEGRLPTCAKITCQRPQTYGTHLSVNPWKDLYSYKDVITFSCSEGYQLTRSVSLMCENSGRFEGRLPTCATITCPRPDLSDTRLSGTPQKNSFFYNETITFACFEGYRLIGATSTTCGNSGHFQETLPICEAITCQKPRLYGTQLSVNPPKNSYAYKEVITFSCSEGYQLIGSNSETCLNSKGFQGGLPNCTAITCQIPNNLSLLRIDPNETTFQYNTTITFSCPNGYNIMGNDYSICRSNANFSENLPKCSEHLETVRSSALGATVGSVVGSLVIIAVIIIAVVIALRRRTRKKPEAKYYKNEALSLDIADQQYAEVNTQRAKKNKEKANKDIEDGESKDHASTYYNMNSTDVQKAKEARQDVYYEFSPLSRTSGTAVPVSDFKTYVENKKGDREFFDAQFKKFFTGLQFPTTAANVPRNRAKNKYKNIYPYDETRVHLKKGNGPKDSDYINASYIHGYGNLKSYIAAQGPLINTIDDFWRMVWNENCEKIVMLTNLFEDDKVKCIQYWPDEDKMETGSMRLEVVDIETFAEFTIRTFNLINGNEQRLIRQFHFTAWPDKGVPSYASSLVHFRSKVVHSHENRKGPMIVHCSAGIGRTGTFIALDYLVHQAKESGYVDVFECVETLRRQRLNMVQTLEQYKFLHEALLEALMCTSSDPSSAEFPQIYGDLLKVDDKTGKRNIDVHFENLGSGFSTLPESVYGFAKNSTNKKKNRYSNILPVDSEMPQLRDNENNPIYINAVFLPAYKTKRSFIATQMPLQETVVDFWQLLYEQKVSTIVMLNQTKSKESKENIGIYWPDQLNAVKEYGPFRVTKKSDTEEADFKRIDLSCCKEEDGEEERKLRLFQCTFWADSSTVPSSILKFLKLINAVELHHDRNNTGPLVVHCMNGAEKTGLFCVLQVVLERMKIEQDVAIHHVIQQMRSIRPSIIPNVEQFKFCHDVVLEFLKQYDAYSNFQ